MCVCESESVRVCVIVCLCVYAYECALVYVFMWIYVRISWAVFEHKKKNRVSATILTNNTELCGKVAIHQIVKINCSDR